MRRIRCSSIRGRYTSRRSTWPTRRIASSSGSSTGSRVSKRAHGPPRCSSWVPMPTTSCAPRYVRPSRRVLNFNARVSLGRPSPPHHLRTCVRVVRVVRVVSWCVAVWQEYLEDTRRMLQERYFQQGRFPNIQGPFFISSKTGKGIGKLHHELMKVALLQPHMQVLVVAAGGCSLVASKLTPPPPGHAHVRRGVYMYAQAP